MTTFVVLVLLILMGLGGFWVGTHPVEAKAAWERIKTSIKGKLHR